MENRFGIKSLQLNPYLLELSDKELKSKTTYNMLSKKGKDENGSVSKNGILQMYLLDLECFPYHQEDKVICDRVSPAKNFQCEERAEMIQRLAECLSHYDRACTNVPRPISPVFTGRTREIRDEIQGEIHKSLAYIGMIYGIVEVFEALSDSSINRVFKYLEEIDEITSKIKLEKIHRDDDDSKVIGSHRKRLEIGAYKTLKKYISDYEKDILTNSDIYYIMAVIFKNFAVYDDQDEQTISDTVCKSLQRYCRKYRLSL